MDALNRKFATVAAVLGLIALPLIGCGDDDPVTPPPPPPDQATANAAMMDSAPEEFNGENGANGDAEASGTFDAEVEVELMATTDASLGSPTNVTVQLQQETEANVFTGVDVDAQTYTGVRVIFRNAQATVEEGSTLNLETGPVTLAAETTITIDAVGDDIVVERQFATSLNAAAGSTVNVLVDLNSRIWLNDATLDTELNTGTVSEADFAAAVEATGEMAGEAQ